MALKRDLLPNDTQLNPITTANPLNTTVLVILSVFYHLYFICILSVFRRRSETLNIHMNLAAAEAFAIFVFLIAYPGARIKVSLKALNSYLPSVLIFESGNVTWYQLLISSSGA